MFKKYPSLDLELHARFFFQEVGWLTYHLHTYFKILNTTFLAVSQETYKLV